MFYRRKTYKILPEKLEVFNAFFQRIRKYKIYY
jgi:hypothetical protein